MRAGDSRAKFQRLRARSPRGATTLSLHFPSTAKVANVRYRGVRATLRARPGGSSLTLLGVGPEGVELELDAPPDFELVIADHTPGLPESAAHLQKARPPWARPSQAGDETVVSRRVEGAR
jgi:hypothetical protein